MCKKHYVTAIKIIIALTIASNTCAMEVDWPEREERHVICSNFPKVTMLSLLEELAGGEVTFRPPSEVSGYQPIERNYPGMPQILTVAQRGDMEGAQLLFALESVKQLEQEEHAEGVNALHVAIEFGHEELVVFLIERGFNIEHTDFSGCTPLIKAAKCGRMSIVKLLIEYCVNRNAVDSHRLTALDHAIIRRDLKLVEYLYDVGVQQKMRIKLTAPNN